MAHLWRGFTLLVNVTLVRRRAQSSAAAMPLLSRLALPSVNVSCAACARLPPHLPICRKLHHRRTQFDFSGKVTRHHHSSKDTEGLHVARLVHRVHLAARLHVLRNRWVACKQGDHSATEQRRQGACSHHRFHFDFPSTISPIAIVLYTGRNGT